MNPTVSFEAQFKHTIAPFTVIVNTPNATINVGSGLMTLTATSAPPNPGPDLAAIVLLEPVPIVDPTTMDFCFTARFAMDPLAPQAMIIPIPAGATGLAGNSDPNDVAAIVYDQPSNQVILFSRGPGGASAFPLGAPDTQPHLWRVTGNAAAQSYVIEKDSDAPIVYVPPAGTYPQEPLEPAAVTSAEATGPEIAQNRMRMAFYCAKAGVPSLLLAPTGLGAQHGDLPEWQRAPSYPFPKKFSLT